MAHIAFTVGRMCCGEVRDFLASCKFKGMDMDYIESSGWISRRFTVRGSDKAILSIHASLKHWAAENES